MSAIERPRVAIVGAGFTGLAAAHRLSRAGFDVTVLESDDSVGGLAGAFAVGGQPLEKFYHHWFTNDRHIMALIEELGTADRILHRPTRTGSYYANTVFRLSSPLDVLRYKPLSFIGRLRLGLLVLQARRVRHWSELESLTAAEWIRAMAGREVFETVWQPLLRGKFGDYADQVSAVWFWNKLVLRGGSRGKGGNETLAYYRGGFAALAEHIADAIAGRGGRVLLNTPVTALNVEQGRIKGVYSGEQFFPADYVVSTIALPLFAELATPHCDTDYLERLRAVRYLGNTCLVLQLDRSLSNTYWLNIADPDFPFVGIIEHTNFEPAASYAGSHIVYLSKYLPTDSPLYAMTADEMFDYATPYLQRIFPEFQPSWVKACHLHRAAHSQPIVTRHYSRQIPEIDTPIDGLLLASMAQIYPEDRGTNYAVREGLKIGEQLIDKITGINDGKSAVQ